MKSFEIYELIDNLINEYRNELKTWKVLKSKYGEDMQIQFGYELKTWKVLKFSCWFTFNSFPSYELKTWKVLKLW